MAKTPGHTGVNQTRLQKSGDQASDQNPVTLDDLISCCDDCCTQLEEKGCHDDVLENFKNLKSKCEEAKGRDGGTGMRAGFDPSTIIQFLPLFIQLMQDFAKFFPNKQQAATE